MNWFTVICEGKKRVVQCPDIRTAHQFGRLLFPKKSFTTREATPAEIAEGEASAQRVIMGVFGAKK